MTGSIYIVQVFQKERHRLTVLACIDHIPSPGPPDGLTLYMEAETVHQALYSETDKRNEWYPSAPYYSKNDQTLRSDVGEKFV